MADKKQTGGESEKGYGQFHRNFFEGRSGVFAVGMTIAILIGGMVEIIPMYSAKAGPETADWVTPYTPLEVAGRDIYIREGCYLCHSQMVRPMRAELLRYGEWTRAAEYQYDRPFLLGSRRMGPDLQRLGGKYPDAWHYEHMRDPRSTSPGSVMPTYPWLLDATIDPADVRASVVALKRVGTPYTDAEVEAIPESLAAQGSQIVQSLATTGIQTEANREIVALIAYLQRLGQDGKRHLSAQGTATADAAPASPRTGGGQ
jgi:cytochrome c oxidase cbb3-type subunit I/II